MQKLVVLIVEDDLMIADYIEEVLVAAGYSVCGIATTTAQAIAMGERFNPNLVVIDFRLAEGDIGTDVGAALHARGGCGVLYASGNPDHPLIEGSEGDGCLHKPYTGASLVAALKIVRECMSDMPLSTFPAGFRLLQRGSQVVPQAVA
jgi:DNA-binding response OmpR family regulator